MKMTCDAAGPLVPSYLDGELSEAQASPLRAHLLDCPACREKAKEGRVLERWFAALREQDEATQPAVPAGFAARTARRAFAGDPGLLTPAAGERRPRGSRKGDRGDDLSATDLDPQDLGQLPGPRQRRSLAPFLMAATALAAALLFVLALAIQKQNLPGGDGRLQAQPPRPPWLLEAPAPRAERGLQTLPGETDGAPARPQRPQARDTEPR